MVILVIGILMTISICFSGWALLERDRVIQRNNQLEYNCRVLRNMYLNLKEVKIEESEWKDMTTAQITKAIIEDQYKKGNLYVDNLLNKGFIQEKRICEGVTNYWSV